MSPAFPAIVEVHGGAWTGGDRFNNVVIHNAIAAAGTAVLAIEFRLAPASPYPAGIADVNLGIRWLKANIARLGRRPGQGRRARHLERRRINCC